MNKETLLQSLTRSQMKVGSPTEKGNCYECFGTKSATIFVLARPFPEDSPTWNLFGCCDEHYKWISGFYEARDRLSQQLTPQMRKDLETIHARIDEPIEWFTLSKEEAHTLLKSK